MTKPSPAPTKAEINLYTRAAFKGKTPEVLAFLKKYGNSCIDCRDDDGKTALTWAAYEGHPDLVQTLLDAGANPNVRTKEGVTPLMYAAWWSHDLNIVTCLLEKGAAADRTDKEGKTALDWVEERDDGNGKSSEIADLLRRWPEIQKQRDAQKKAAEELAEIHNDFHGGLKKPLRYNGPLKFPKPKVRSP